MYILRYRVKDAYMATNNRGESVWRDAYFETAPMSMSEIRTVRASLETDDKVSQIKLVKVHA